MPLGGIFHTCKAFQVLLEKSIHHWRHKSEFSALLNAKQNLCNPERWGSAQVWSESRHGPVFQWHTIYPACRHMTWQAGPTMGLIDVGARTQLSVMLLCSDDIQIKSCCCKERAVSAQFSEEDQKNSDQVTFSQIVFCFFKKGSHEHSCNTGITNSSSEL